MLHHQPSQDQQRPHLASRTGPLTVYTSKHHKISSGHTCPAEQVHLQPTSTNTTRSTAATLGQQNRSTYNLHQQTPQDQQRPHLASRTGPLTDYTNKHHMLREMGGARGLCVHPIKFVRLICQMGTSAVQGAPQLQPQLQCT